MQHKSILIIEDDKKDLENVKKELASLKIKHALKIAHNGAEGLEMLTSSEKNQLPDLILLNLNMPKMNGFEFLSIIRSYHNLKHIKVYVISNSKEEYDRQLVMNSGANGYIVKPLSFSGRQELPEPVMNLKADLV